MSPIDLPPEWEDPSKTLDESDYGPSDAPRAIRLIAAIGLGAIATVVTVLVARAEGVSWLLIIVGAVVAGALVCARRA